jgi:hypothetical protein
MKLMSINKKVIATLMAVLMVAAVSTVSAFAADPSDLESGQARIFQNNSTTTLSMANAALVDNNDDIGSYTAVVNGSSVTISIPVQVIEVGAYEGYIEDETVVTYNNVDYAVSVSPSPYPDDGTLSFTLPAAALSGTSPLKLDVTFVVGLYVEDEESGDHTNVTDMPAVADLYLGL